MRIIKLGIISIVVFAMLITLISLFFPSRIRISKAKDISADKTELLKALTDTSSMKKWGADSMQTSLVNDSLVTINKMKGINTASSSGFNLYVSPVPHAFTVQWYMDVKLKWYPWEKFSGLLLEKRYGPQMEAGLDSLKSYLETPAR
jgi:hypothetical protein